jgi:carbonic anhydrase
LRGRHGRRANHRHLGLRRQARRAGWGKLDPAYKPARKGHEQSPIDIRGAHLNKALQPIEFHYIAGPVTLENNGHTVVVHVDPGSYIVAGGVRYDLVEFHFHHPSEETVKGKLSDMESTWCTRAPTASWP